MRALQVKVFGFQVAVYKNGHLHMPNGQSICYRADQVRPATPYQNPVRAGGNSSVRAWSALVLLLLGHMNPPAWEAVLEKNTQGKWGDGGIYRLSICPEES